MIEEYECVFHFILCYTGSASTVATPSSLADKATVPPRLPPEMCKHAANACYFYYNGKTCTCRRHLRSVIMQMRSQY